MLLVQVNVIMPIYIIIQKHMLEQPLLAFVLLFSYTSINLKAH